MEQPVDPPVEESDSPVATDDQVQEENEAPVSQESQSQADQTVDAVELQEGIEFEEVGSFDDSLDEGGSSQKRRLRPSEVENTIHGGEGESKASKKRRLRKKQSTRLDEDDYLMIEETNEGKKPESEASGDEGPAVENQEAGNEGDDISDFIVTSNAPKAGAEYGAPQYDSNVFAYLTRASEFELERARNIFGDSFYETMTAPVEDTEIEDANVESEDAHKVTREEMLEIFDPQELKEGYLTKEADEIRSRDFPEEIFQLLKDAENPKIQSFDGSDFEKQAEWILSQISKEDVDAVMLDDSEKEVKLSGIQSILSYIFEKSCDIPYISMYGRDYIDGFDMEDEFWEVLDYSRKYYAMLKLKASAIAYMDKMLEKVQQSETIAAESLDAETANKNAIFQEYRMILEDCSDEIQLRDFIKYLSLHHSKKNVARSKASENQQRYWAVASNAQVAAIAKRISISAEEFGQNVLTELLKYENRPLHQKPEELLSEMGVLSSRILDDVVNKISYEFGCEPCVLIRTREMLAPGDFDLEVTSSEEYLKRSAIAKYDKDEVRHLVNAATEMSFGGFVRLSNDDMYMRLAQAAEDGFIEIKIAINEEKRAELLNYITGMYITKKYSEIETRWNEIREDVVANTLDMYVIPQIRQEFETEALKRCYKNIVHVSCKSLFDSINFHPYEAEFSESKMEELKLRVEARMRRRRRRKKEPDENLEVNITVEENLEMKKELTVLAVACNETREFSENVLVLLDAHGHIVDRAILPNLFLRAKPEEKSYTSSIKDEDVLQLKRLLVNWKPDVLVLAASGVESKWRYMDLDSIVEAVYPRGDDDREVESSAGSQPARTVKDEARVAELRETLGLTDDDKAIDAGHRVHVTLMSNTLGSIYASSKRSQSELPGETYTFKCAVSVGRRLLDPLCVYCGLAADGSDDILSLSLHPLQKDVPRYLLLPALRRELTVMVNAVGFDINEAVRFKHRQPMIQFLSGLGPIKSREMILNIERGDKGYIESRKQLETKKILPKNTYRNCAGFIFIRRETLKGLHLDPSQFNLLDRTRIHPESYQISLQMARDALQSTKLTLSNAERIIYDSLYKALKTGKPVARTPIDDLDLEKFAEILAAPPYNSKVKSTLEIIKNEVKEPFKDYRAAFVDPEGEDLFYMILGETPESFYTGVAIDATVMGVVRNQGTSRVKGLRCMLSNGAPGYIPYRNFPEEYASHSEYLELAVGKVIRCIVEEINFANISTLLKIDEETIREKLNELRVEEEGERAYYKRMIKHPLFHNITRKEAEEELEGQDFGEVIFRPSSRGRKYIAATWKFVGGTFYNVVILEEKDNVFNYELGKRLKIGQDVFGDLDEILERHIIPIQSYTSDVMSSDHFLNGSREDISEELKRKKESHPSSIPYAFSPNTKFPGHFALSYMPGARIAREDVKVTSKGISFRRATFQDIVTLTNWFKGHYREKRA